MITNHNDGRSHPEQTEEDNTNQVQQQHERSVGDAFASWLSATTGQSCVFQGRPDRAPDLQYSFAGSTLQLEVTGAYYDADHAEFLWDLVRDDPDASTEWAGEDPDRLLAAAVRTCIERKSRKDYGSNVALLVHVPPGITSAERLAELLAADPVKHCERFIGIYVAGTFPMTEHSDGGYRVFPVQPIAMLAPERLQVVE